ncbi:MAG: Ig-like domain-containing protein, partial [Firmicutes bacterium]|nr:Ig-like domain-containing protein [Bacillota bacterium]
TDLELYYNGEVQVLNPVVMVDEDGDGLDKDDVLTPGTDYTLSYTHTETNVTSTAPVNSGTYKVYVTKSQNYKISGTVYAGTLKIKPIPLDWTEIVFGDTNIIYEGKYVPKVKLRHAQEEFYFVEDVDYTVSYVNLLSNSVYTPSTVVVTPKAGGNLTTVGSSITELRQPFSIGTRSILNDCLSYFTDNENSRLYDGTNFKPTVYVRDIALNKILTQDVHYTVSYRDSDGKLVSSLNKTGDYTVIITGIGEYSGTDKLTFKIFGTDISKYKVNLYEYSVMANGSARTPIITSVTLGSIATLNASNYSVSYKDPFGNPVSLLRSPGTYKVVVTGRGSYEGSTSAEFRIIGTPQKIAMTKTSYKVYKSTKPFTLSALSSGDTTGYHYESSNPAVASVTQAGTVTIHKLGRAKITVTTTGMFFSDPASTNVYIKVHPNKTTLSKKPWTDGKGNFRVRWKTQKDVDLYQIRYSTSSKFKSYKTKTVTASELYATQSTKISGLKSGKKYYVKVRAVKLVKNDAGDELKYYGKWSGWKSVVTK